MDKNSLKAKIKEYCLSDGGVLCRFLEYDQSPERIADYIKVNRTRKGYVFRTSELICAYLIALPEIDRQEVLQESRNELTEKRETLYKEEIR